MRSLQYRLLQSDGAWTRWYDATSIDKEGRRMQVRVKPKEKKPKYYQHKETQAAYPARYLSDDQLNSGDYEPVRVKKWKQP